MQITIENTTIPFHIQYGKGKKLSIYIDSIGLITVQAPNGTSEDIIIKVIQEHGKWILQKLDAISQLQEIAKPKQYDDQGKFFYLGKEYFLYELIETDEQSKEELMNNLKKFYIYNCKKIIEKRIKIYQQKLRVKPKIIEIVESKHLWGSCSSDKKLTFNYRLAMTPVEVIDYVIIHELCHLLHMNHDRSFWRLVGSIMPDYKQKQEFLALQGQYMTL